MPLWEHKYILFYHNGAAHTWYTLSYPKVVIPWKWKRAHLIQKYHVKLNMCWSLLKILESNCWNSQFYQVSFVILAIIPWHVTQYSSVARETGRKYQQSSGEVRMWKKLKTLLKWWSFSIEPLEFVTLPAKCPCSAHWAITSQPCNDWEVAFLPYLCNDLF